MSFTTVANVPGFSWSYSVLKNYEVCPRRYHSYNVLKDVQEPESDQLRQGNLLHAAFEARVTKGEELPLGMGMHEPMLARLASAPGKTYAERKLGLTSAFEPTSFFGARTWFRIVLDYTNIRPTQGGGTIATVVDYKTGKPATDTTQLQLSAATLFAHDPKIDRVKAALVFVAHGESETAEYARSDTTEIWSEVLPRVRKVIEARQQDHYPPKPGGLCRRYCAVVSCPFHGK
jgi:hypothetical protein